MTDAANRTNRGPRVTKGGYPSGPRKVSELGPPPKAWTKPELGDDEHECVFVEEQEPNGRLILPRGRRSRWCRHHDHLGTQDARRTRCCRGLT